MLQSAALRLLQSPLLGAGTRERNVALATEPLLIRWRNRLRMMLLFATLSMLLSLTTVLISMHDGKLDGTEVVVRLADRMAIFCHALALLALFGTAPEVYEPLALRLGRCLAACLDGSSEGQIRAFPRSASGVWG